MLLLHFALGLLKNQPLNSGKCERRVASKRNGQHWLSAWLVAPQAGVSQSHELSSPWDRLFLWITQKDSVLLCCLERDMEKKHGKSCLQFNYYPKDSWLIWYPSCRCAAPVKNLHFFMLNYKHQVSCPVLLMWINNLDHVNHVSPAFSLRSDCRR